METIGLGIIYFCVFAFCAVCIYGIIDAVKDLIENINE